MADNFAMAAPLLKMLGVDPKEFIATYQQTIVRIHGFDARLTALEKKADEILSLLREKETPHVRRDGDGGTVQYLRNIIADGF